MAKYPLKTKGIGLPDDCEMHWHFNGTGHGKGPHDGAGAVVKQVLRRVQIARVKLDHANDVVAYLREYFNREHAAYAAAKGQVKRVFREIKIDEVDCSRLYNCKTVPGSRKLHSICSVSSTDPTLLQIRE